MAKVTKIERQKKRENRFSIFIDDRFAVGLSEAEIVSFDIHLGKEISQKELRKIKEHSSFEKIKDKALRLISIRPRSQSELFEKLSAKKYEEEQIRKVISFLKKEKLLNDLQFAKQWIYHRTEFGNYGKRRIELELWRKKVPQEIVKKETAKISPKKEFIRAYEIGLKKWKLLKDDEIQKKREKLIGFLSRKGYSWDIILKVLEKLKN